MAYEWQKREVDAITGIPYAKGPRVNLEKDGVKKRFTCQEDVDAAWADGWHIPGRPETADIQPEPNVEPKTESPKKRPGRPRKKRDMSNGNSPESHN